METSKSSVNRPSNVNSRDEIILVTSIRRRRPNSSISSLIESGCANASTKMGESPLHRAISRRTTKVANELIKSGANLNALDASGTTPLYCAIVDHKLEMVDMLLYYGADISIWSDLFTTPPMMATQMITFQIFGRLIRYYDEYSCITQQNKVLFETRLLSINSSFPTWMVCEDTFFLRISMHCGIPELFKLIWERLDHEKLLVGPKPFLVTYWTSKLPSFTTSNWLDCLNLILNSPCAVRFVEQCNKYRQLYFPKLIGAFDQHGVNKNDRLAVLYSLFSLGFEVCCSDIDWIRLHYGFNEEFEACIYGGNYRGRISDVYCDSPFLTFIFGLEQECSVAKVFELFKHWPPNICHYCKFFSLFPDMKSELQESWNRTSSSDRILHTFGKASTFYASDIAKELSQMSEFPSLLELSRNAAQNCIRKNYGANILKPYGFYDVVRGLLLPENLKDVLIFTRPIYQ